MYLENRMVIDSEWGWLGRGYADEEELLDDLYTPDDDELDELEERFGSMDNVDVDALAEIIEANTGNTPVAVEWDDKFDAIVYKYYEEAA